MLEPSSPHSLQPSTTKHIQSLDQEAFLSHLTQRDISDARRYFEYARYKTRKHDKVEMGAGTIVGILLGWLLGGGTWQGSTAVGIVAFLATLLVIFTFHWIRSPSAFHKAAIVEADSAKLLLEQEKAKNAEPKLAGEIICFDEETAIETGDNDVSQNCFLTINLSLWNESDAATMVSGLTCELLWKETAYPAFRIPITGYYVQRTMPVPAPWEKKYEVTWVPLTEFPVDEEITNTNYKNGWLRFFVGRLPLETGKGGVLDKALILRLGVLDRTRKPHMIYEGSVDLPGCGDIQRSKQVARFETTPDGRPSIKLEEEPPNG